MTDPAAMREELPQGRRAMLLGKVGHVARDRRVEIDDAASREVCGESRDDDLRYAAEAKAMRGRGCDIELEIGFAEGFRPQELVAANDRDGERRHGRGREHLAYRQSRRVDGFAIGLARVGGGGDGGGCKEERAAGNGHENLPGSPLTGGQE